jgi:hypothetical protein
MDGWNDLYYTTIVEVYSDEQLTQKIDSLKQIVMFEPYLKNAIRQMKSKRKKAY